MSQKSLSIAYAVRRQSKGLGPIPATRATVAPDDAQLSDIIDESEAAPALEPIEPEAPKRSVLDQVMQKHKFFAQKAQNES